MPSFLSTTFRLLLIPISMWTGFVMYGYGLELFSTVIPIPEERSFGFGALLAQGFLAAAVVTRIFSSPLAQIYRKNAVAVALVMSIPVLVLRLPELLKFSRHPYAIAISGYEVIAYAVLLIAGVWRSHNHTVRPNIANRSSGKEPLLCSTLDVIDDRT